MKNLEAVNKIINALKLNNRDEHVSKRFILKLLRDTSSFLLSQKMGERSLVAENNLYTTIPCFEFEKIDAVKCSNIEFRRCKTLMKSVKPLPKLIFSRLGASIKEIVSLDGDYRFVFLEKGQYQRNKRRQNSIEDEVYVYLDSDMHLYIPDRQIFTVDLTVLTPNTEEVKNCSSCSDNNCKSNWEEEFVCSDKLESSVFNQVLQILGVSRGVKSDENPNNLTGA